MLDQEDEIRHEIMQSIQSRLKKRRTFVEKFADMAVKFFGSFSFFFMHIVIFVFWILINLGRVTWLRDIFDPYPFNLLTMSVSLEAIFLSIFVLMSQNREAKIADLRQELDFQVNMIAEKEITKVINLLAYLMNHLDVPYEQDPELRRMMRPLNIDEIRRELERELRLREKKKPRRLSG